MKTHIIMATVVGIVLACTSQTEQSPVAEMPASSLVMAEVSELAQLMKNIHADAKDWRTALLNGELVQADTSIYRLLTESTPTNKNVKGPVFEGFSSYYQEKLNAFLSASEVDLAKAQYNNLVTACVQCHQSYCTGPIPTIEKLYVPVAN